MRSFIAALRSLVLPFGATTGRRIVLDGTLGTITIYDTNGNKLMSLDGTNGLVVYDTSGNIRTRLALPGGFYSFLELATAQASEVSKGFLINTGVGVSPNAKSWFGMGASDLGFGTMQWRVISNQNGATSPMIELVTAQLGLTTSGRPILNLVGTDFGGTPLQPRVVVGDLWYGEDNGEGVVPTQVQSLPRGVKDSPTWKFENAADTVLSTVNGTYTSIITTGNIALKAGRLYRVHAKIGTYLSIGGSAQTAADTWRFRVYRSIGGGAAATMRLNRLLRSGLAAAAAVGVHDMTGYFSPAVSGNVSFILEAARTAGAATVTSTVSTDGGEGYSELTIEDIGAYAAGALH
jgi:hypothetical protein